MARLNNYMNMNITSKEFHALPITYRSEGKDIKLLALGYKDDELIDLFKLGESERNAFIRYFESLEDEEKTKELLEKNKDLLERLNDR